MWCVECASPSVSLLLLLYLTARAAAECGEFTPDTDESQSADDRKAGRVRRPFMALIRNLADPALDCSGAIIGSAFVITSASCFCARAGNDKESSSLQQGRTDKGRIDCKSDGKVGVYAREALLSFTLSVGVKKVAQIPLAKVYIHQNYSSEEPSKSDIALVRLKNRLTISQDDVTPICILGDTPGLSSKEAKSGKLVIFMAGWGSSATAKQMTQRTTDSKRSFPCLTNQYGPRKFKPCPPSSPCVLDKPPMFGECAERYVDRNATDITALGDRKFCYNARNNVNGWCLVAPPAADKKNKRINLKWGFCSETCPNVEGSPEPRQREVQVKIAEGCGEASGTKSKYTFCVTGLVKRPSITYMGGPHRAKPKILKGGYYPEFSFGGPCFNERGAPLYTIERRPPTESGKTIASLVGIASVDGDCNEKNSAFAVTDFGAYLPWITELMLVEMTARYPHFDFGSGPLQQRKGGDGGQRGKGGGLREAMEILGRLYRNESKAEDLDEEDKRLLFPLLLNVEKLGLLNSTKKDRKSSVIKKILLSSKTEVSMGKAGEAASQRSSKDSSESHVAMNPLPLGMPLFGARDSTRDKRGQEKVMPTPADYDGRGRDVGGDSSERVSFKISTVDVSAAGANVEPVGERAKFDYIPRHVPHDITGKGGVDKSRGLLQYQADHRAHLKHLNLSSDELYAFGEEQQQQQQPKVFIVNHPKEDVRLSIGQQQQHQKQQGQSNKLIRPSPYTELKSPKIPRPSAAIPAPRPAAAATATTSTTTRSTTVIIGHYDPYDPDDPYDYEIGYGFYTNSGGPSHSDGGSVTNSNSKNKNSDDSDQKSVAGSSDEEAEKDKDEDEEGDVDDILSSLQDLDDEDLQSNRYSASVYHLSRKDAKNGTKMGPGEEEDRGLAERVTKERSEKGSVDPDVLEMIMKAKDTVMRAAEKLQKQHGRKEKDKS